MSELSDPNVIYKGDVEESFDYSSVGDLLVKRFKMGGNKVALVKIIKKKFWKFLIKISIIFRLMDIQIKNGLLMTF